MFLCVKLNVYTNIFTLEKYVSLQKNKIGIWHEKE